MAQGAGDRNPERADRAGRAHREATRARPSPGSPGWTWPRATASAPAQGGVALITFLNGSTVTLLSETEVTVKQAPTGRAKAAGIRMLIHAGRVWARVVQAAGSRSTLTLESNDYTATAHDGLIGAEQHRPAPSYAGRGAARSGSPTRAARPTRCWWPASARGRASACR